MDDLDYHLNIILGKDAGILFLCIFGAILNSIMLYLLLSKKQVRSSVHTVYMVQIAVTDLLVCLVWLVLTSVITHNMLQMRKGAEEHEVDGVDSNASTAYAAAVVEEESSPTQYRSWRIMYYWYNFHYYTNILLLASMSVERCAAVWKSMRCQRYQYNRKIIIGISVFMWIVAFAFVLPNLVDPDLMVSDSDSPSSISRTVKPTGDDRSLVSPGGLETKPSDALSEIFGGRPPKDIAVGGEAGKGGSLASGQNPLARPFEREEKNFQENMDILYACYALMAKSVDDEDSYVRSHGRVTVHGCVEEMYGISRQYASKPSGKETSGNATSEPNLDYSAADYYGDYDYPPYDDSSLEDIDASEVDYEGTVLAPFEVYNKTTDELIGLDQAMYQVLLSRAVDALMTHHRNFRASRNEACDPNLSHPARIFVLVINLVLGFFVPFSIIVFSYVSIAYMIGKRARSRMNPAPSETSTTHFAHNYLQNPSSTNALPGAIRWRDKRSRHGHDSVGRRLSDFVRNWVLRKSHDGAENRSYLTDSDREATPFGSMQKMHYSSASRRFDESSSVHAKSDDAIRYRSTPKDPDTDKSSSDDPTHDPNLQEATRQSNSVCMRGGDTPRIKKYSFCYDAANDNIPQTIAEEHPHEVEAETEDDRHCAAGGGFGPSDTTPPGLRNHMALLMVQRNSRRESGGSYGSSMDSMATDQTSLMTSLPDKRYSAATTTSALTPPTPIEPSNPNSNQFFPSGDERMAHYRTQSAEAGYPLLPEHRDDQQRSPRSQKPGSQLNDITFKLYSKSLQKKHFEDADADNLPKLTEHDVRPTDPAGDQAQGTSGSVLKSPERYSFPRMTRSKSAPDERLGAFRLNARSAARLANEQRRPSSSADDRACGQEASQKPKYSRLSSTTSTTHYIRGRTYSTISRGSVSGVNTLRKTMALKNAERHLRVSRTVLAYVIVFSICWLPQRITYLLYVIEALMGATNTMCIKLISGVRLLSFVSVLLNPAVYILTQREFQAYVRNSACVTVFRRWYAKCSKKSASRLDFNVERSATSDPREDDDVEMQLRREPEEREVSGGNRQADAGAARPPPYRVQSPARANMHTRKSPTHSGQHEMFAPMGGINARRHDATIDEMREEEAAAEESFEKERQRIAAEKEKRCQDDINKNFLESSEDDVISAKNTTGSGNKTTSSSSKSENFEEFWMRWLENGGRQLLSPNGGNLSRNDAPTATEPRFPDLEQLAKVGVPNSGSQSGVLD